LSTPTRKEGAFTRRGILQIAAHGNAFGVAHIAEVTAYILRSEVPSAEHPHGLEFEAVFESSANVFPL
jgi:hypothetical protein